jgi:hypothetical protein
MRKKLPGILAAGLLLSMLGATPAMAQTPADLKVGMDTVWVLITASLVFFMNLGFALVESGFCRAKNTVNILSKNFIVFAISCLAFYVFGWGLMFGNGTGFVGIEGLLMLGGADNSPATGDAYAGAYKSIAWTGVPLTRSSSSSSSSPARPRRSSRARWPSASSTCRSSSSRSCSSRSSIP